MSAKKFCILGWMALALLSVPLIPVAEAQDSEALRAYERAREFLDQEDYRDAIERFRELREEYPKSKYAANSMYWEAFSRYRLGSRRDLRQAEQLLREQAELYGEASTRADAERLLTRVLGEMAERGDPDAGREVHERAEGDIDQETRMAALNAILHMDSERALPLLKKVMGNPDRNNDEMRAQAIFLLAQHFDEEAEQIMVDALRNDPSTEVREQAMFWLGQSAGDRVVGLVSEVLKDGDLSDLHENAVFALSQSDSEDATRMLREMAGDETIDDEIRGNCIFWLGQREGSFDFLASLYHELDDDEMKEAVIFGMSQRGGRQEVEWLRERFYDEDEDMELRNNSLFWLAQNDEFGVAELAALYQQVDHLEMREQVIFALSQKGRKATDALIEIARTEKDLELRKNVIFWLGNSGDARALDYLEELIDQ